VTIGEARNLDRALGALYGLAIGDALGMPTQLLSQARVRALYGHVEGFERPTDDHPIAAGLPAGSITDDTEQAVLLGQLLIDGGGDVDPVRFAEELIGWERRVVARGGLDLLGPSTRRALAALNAGVSPEEAGRYGDTNGAAMRIAPVGIAFPPNPLATLVDTVAATSRATHNTGLAIAGAAAVAAAVSVGIAGEPWRIAVDTAIGAAELGAGKGHWVAGADVASRISWAIGLVDGLPEAAAARAITQLVGTSLATQEAVPAAFAVLAATQGNPWRAALLAANLGGDADTIGAMAGAIGGACVGFSALPPEAVAIIRRVNDLDLESLARRLLDLRSQRLAGGPFDSRLASP
jgi:ADP-ribosylglycohydrolase